MEMITVVIKEPGKNPEVKKISNTLESMQEVVGGYIELLSLSNQIDLWINEEGLLKNLPFNTHVRGIPIFGTIFAAASNSQGETVGLTKSQIDKMLNLL